MSTTNDAAHADRRADGRSGAGRLPGWLVVVAWGVTALLAGTGLASMIEQLVEGVDASQVSKLPALWTGLAVAAAVALSVAWARGRGAPQQAGTAPAAAGLGRRRFLLGSAAVAGGAAGVAAAIWARLYPWWTLTVAPIARPRVETTSPHPLPEWHGARVRAYRRLGRTGFEVSDISLGSGRITNTTDGADGEAIAREAIERGVNYFDTAPDYAGSGSETLLGRAMKGRRDRMFLATKFCTPHGHLAEGSSVAQYMEAVEGSLRRLQTDYVDLVHVHSCNSVGRLMDPNAHEAFDRLKQAGKVRFLGFSTHTPKLVEVTEAAIASERFDVMMLAYHFGSWPRLGELIDRAADVDMGVVAMKTLKGARHRGVDALRGRGEAYSQAAFKWVLSNPSVSCLVVSFFEQQHVDEYLYASGRAPGAGDIALLQGYDRATAGTYCRPHCGECLDACPEGVPIADVLRHRMYFEDYGTQKLAMQEYAQLATDASACSNCPAPCAGVCPDGIDIHARASGAHRLLTFEPRRHPAG